MITRIIKNKPLILFVVFLFLNLSVIEGYNWSSAKAQFQKPEAGKQSIQSTQKPPVGQYKVGLEQLNAYFSKLEKLQSLIKKSDFDVREKARELGSDVEKIFKFVRDEVAFEVYSGVLRGAKGTLVGRAGNSLDKSTLLAQLLKENGFTIRFIQGQLDNKKARSLINQMFQRKPKADEGIKFDESFLRDLGLSDDKYKRLISEHQANREKFFEDLFKRVDEDYRFIKTVLDENKVKLGASSSSSYSFLLLILGLAILGLSALMIYFRIIRSGCQLAHAKKQAILLSLGVVVGLIMVFFSARGILGKDVSFEDLIKESKDHFWVQYKKADKWIDLDPSFNQAQMGERFAKEVKLFEKEIPSEFYHSITFDVKIEQMKGREFKINSILKKSFKVADLFGVSIRFSNLPNLPQDDYALANLDKVTKFLPIVTINGEPFYDRGFNLSGDVLSSVDFTPVGAIGAGIAGAAGTIIGKLGTILGEPSPADKAVLTAQWLEFEVRSPGGQDKVYTREILDRIGIENRGGGSGEVKQIKDQYKDDKRVRHLLFRSYTIQIASSFLSESFVVNELVSQLLRKKSLWQGVLQIKYGTPVSQEKLSVENIGKLSNEDSELKVLTFNLATASLADRLGQSRYRDLVFYHHIPNIILYKTAVDLRSDGKVITQEGFDIVENSLKVINKPNTHDVSAQFNLILGIVHTAMERDMGLRSQEQMDRMLEAQMKRQGVIVRSLNTIDVSNETKKLGGRHVLLNPGEKINVNRLRLSAEAKARILRDLESGHTVLVPEENVNLDRKSTVGWWRINTTSGHALGLMESGEGSTMIEYIFSLTWLGIIHFTAAAALCAEMYGPGNLGCLVTAAVLSVCTTLGIAFSGLGGLAVIYSCYGAGLSFLGPPAWLAGAD